ncbi:fumarylacetoacetate hydrolase family protein [Microbacterium sp. No. 7]|uniref:fumarylacetoacetate hydrolase family protein n=1 Tax=Microbacterium sp. No. 7 TaxID=1714373 RepID=UPI0006ECDD1A|nr:fumarylacetoacetate hydrolase family protein [Microbacterium sp. No. 7]ALJ21392.1 hydrolase [Microbacterium sp. No. 7]
MDSFSIGAVEVDGSAFPAVFRGDDLYDVRQVLPGISSTRQLFAEWDVNLDAIAAHLESPVAAPQSLSALTRAGRLRILPPLQPMGTIFAAGVNYREHIIEMAVAHKLGKTGASDEQLRADAAADIDVRVAEGDPYVWVGIPSAVSGARDDVQLPDFGTDVDWEAELGVVIGRRAHRVATEDALNYVAGYVIVNDISARSLVPREDIAKIGTDWFRAKNQPTFFPVGPVVVPARFVPDPSDLSIQLRLNGELMQDSSTSNMAFGVSELISYVSSVAIVDPGDLLITGSPAGNGSHWNRFLQDGDVMEVTITGLGTQRTAVRGPSGILPPWQASRPSKVGA